MRAQTLAAKLPPLEREKRLRVEAKHIQTSIFYTNFVYYFCSEFIESYKDIFINFIILQEESEWFLLHDFIL